MIKISLKESNFINTVFKLCFFLFSALYGMETEQRWYKKFLDNRNIGIPASALVGGGIGAGLKYLLHKNKFLSSFRTTKTIKHASYFKFAGLGVIIGFGLYELLKQLKKPKKSDGDKKSEEEKPKEDYDKEITVLYICLDNLYSLFNSEHGLKTKTANQIENILSTGEIKKYNKSYFWFCSIGNLQCLKLSCITHAAALYLINKDQKESFEDLFKEGSSKKESFLYDLYQIKPISKENLLCYALPLEYSVNKKDKKTYSLEINSEITKDNIDSYSFQLSEEDADKINSHLHKNDLFTFKSRTNYS